MTGPGLAGRLRALGEKAGRRLGRLTGETAPDARAGRPFAEFAGVLDGRHLWLAVADAGADDALGLLLPDGTVERLDAEHEPAAPSAPPVLATRVDLVDLVSTAGWAGRVTEEGLTVVPVLVTRGEPRPVWTQRGSLASRERRPGSLPPGLRPRLSRTEDGTLELVLQLGGSPARAAGFAQGAAGIEVRVQLSAPVTGARVVDPVGTGGTGGTGGTVADLSVAPTEDGVVVHVPPGVPLPAQAACAVVVDATVGPLPVARVDDDVADAEPATRMPGVVSADGASQVRFGWDRDGHLLLCRDRLSDERDAEDDEPADGVAP